MKYYGSVLLLPSGSGAHVPSLEPGGLWDGAREAVPGLQSLRFPHPEPQNICLGSSWHAGTKLQLVRGSRCRGPEAPPTVLAELGADVSTPGQTRGPSRADPLAPLSCPRQTWSLTRRAHAASPNCRFTSKTKDCWKPLRFKVSYNAARDKQKN